MIVVADSSPLQYLILLEQTPLLAHLYQQVFLPDAVAAELRAARAPQSVREWMSRPPSWIEVVPVTADEAAPIAAWLDRGERAAIALAERLHADLILIDETEGRAEAVRRSFRVTGTLGILLLAAEEGLIDVPDVLDRLNATSFYTDQHLLNKLFRKWLA
jgi:predicted nucleic acid-binding protein